MFAAALKQAVNNVLKPGGGNLVRQAIERSTFTLLAQSTGSSLVEKGLISHRHTLLNRYLRCQPGFLDLGNIRQFTRGAIWLTSVKGQFSLIANRVSNQARQITNRNVGATAKVHPFRWILELQ